MDVTRDQKESCSSSSMTYPLCGSRWVPHEPAGSSTSGCFVLFCDLVEAEGCATGSIIHLTNYPHGFLLILQSWSVCRLSFTYVYPKNMTYELPEQMNCLAVVRTFN